MLSEIPEYGLEKLMRDMPELPTERRTRYLSLGINPEDVEMYIRDRALSGFFEAVIEAYVDAKDVKLASNYIANDLVKIIRDSSGRATENKDNNESFIPISVESFRSIIDMIRTSKISSRSAKDLLTLSISDARNPEDIAKEKGLIIDTSPEDLVNLISKLISDNPTVVQDFKSGKRASLEYLVGQAMKALRGAGDAGTLRSLLAKSLE